MPLRAWINVIVSGGVRLTTTDKPVDKQADTERVVSKPDNGEQAWQFDDAAGSDGV